jgi:sugar fermentation stimulation protein A
MKFPAPLFQGTLHKRHRRSLVDVKLDDGRIVTAHNASFGQMTTCCEIGRPVLLSESLNEGRRHPHTWEMIDMNSVWIGVNPANARKAVLEAIAGKTIPLLKEHELQHEATFGRSRKIDLILEGMEHNCFVNIHNVTWAENDVAYFPDAVSPPSQKSMQELAGIARQGHRAVAVFVVQRSDCSRFKPAEHVDKDFLNAILAAENAGVEILVYRAVVTPQEVTLGSLIPYSSA